MRPVRRSLTLLTLALAIALGLTLLVSALLYAQTPASCTHYASPTGTGAVCTAAQPCRVASWWPLAGPGKTLCLQSGTYTGESSMITPPPGVRGTATKPVTIRSEHDGQVLLDANHQGSAVSLSANTYLVIEGINGMNGRDSIFNIGGSHNIIRRAIGWNGTTGYNPYVFYVWGTASVAEDCAGWGMNVRKVMNGSQADNVQGAGFRRCWAEWNDHPQGESNPSNTFQLGYNTTNQLYENVLGTWDTRGQVSEPESALQYFINSGDEPNDAQGSRVLGSIFYTRPGATYTPGSLIYGYGSSGLLFQDIAAIVAPEHPHVTPWYAGAWSCAGSDRCIGNVCRNCLMVHQGSPLTLESGAGWTTPGLRQGQGLAAATGGASAFALLPMICKEVVGGTLTDTPLWPWKMDARIREARIASGFPPVTVTETITSLLGDIPASCRRGTTPEPPEPPGPPASATPLSCVGVLRDGAVAVACVPQTPEGRR